MLPVARQWFTCEWNIFGFYQTPDVPAKAIEIETMIENTSMRLLLPMPESWGQYCDAASDLLG